MLEWVVQEHRPALQTLYVEERASDGWVTLERDEPLNDWQQALYRMLTLKWDNVEVECRNAPHILHSIRASPMIPANFVRDGAAVLGGDGRRPPRCRRRARALRNGTISLMVYCMTYVAGTR